MKSEKGGVLSIHKSFVNNPPSQLFLQRKDIKKLKSNQFTRKQIKELIVVCEWKINMSTWEIHCFEYTRSKVGAIHTPRNKDFHDKFDDGL